MNKQMKLLITSLLILFTLTTFSQVNVNPTTKHFVVVDNIRFEFDNELEAHDFAVKAISKNNEAKVRQTKTTHSIFKYQSSVYDFNESLLAQGEVSNKEARINKKIINRHILKAHEQGFSVFEIGALDAYIDVRADNYNRATEESIILQSNMEFRMSDNTHLRVQPNETIAYALLSAHSKENVIVTGGNLWGDRYEHDYSINNTHEFGYGVYFRGVINGTVNGVSIQEMTGDGFIVQSTAQRNDDGTEKKYEVYSKDITLTQNFISKNRRNNISLTDVDGMLIENNKISYGGVDGVMPKYNIDLEAYRNYTSDGDLRVTEIVKNVVIRNNEFTGAENGDIDLQNCSSVDIYENKFDSYIANVGAFDIQIHDNTFINTGELAYRQFAIQLVSKIENGVDYNHSYSVYNNYISNYENGFKIGTTNSEIYNNTIEECYTGIMLLSGDNNNYKDNVIRSAINASRGYYTLSGVEANVKLDNEFVDVKEFAILLQNTSDLFEVNGGNFQGFKGIEFRDSGVINLNAVETNKVTNKNSKININ